MAEGQFSNKDVPLDWIIPAEIQTKFVNNIVVQGNGEEFVISFFEIVAPILLGDPETVIKKVNSMESIPATCVARVVVSRGQLKKFIDALTSHYDKSAQE